MRYVYDFDEEAPGGRELLGGKGVGLAEMTALGVPVPAGFTITTDACRAYMAAAKEVPDGLDDEVGEHIAALEEKAGKRFGDPSDPLLVSVRSGAKISMPGMMDTILNLGLNDVAVEGQAASTGNPRFAYDSYRRLIQMYGEVVDGVDAHRFEGALTDLKAARGVANDVDLGADDLHELIATFKRIYEEEIGSPFPQDAREQLRRAYRAVFDSWDAPRAQVYRRTYEIPDDIGTAVNVVQMVFGNKGESSGTGVCFTRDPSTGEDVLYGEYLVNAQGEDVVAGIRTPEPISAMRERLPEAYEQLTATLERLEAHYRDMQDIEFTVEEGKLYLLQTRTGKRTAGAALRIAVEMAGRGADLARGGGGADRRGAARPAAAPDDRPERAGRGGRPRPERVARRRVGRDRARRRHGRGAREGGRRRHPRALGDDAGRHPRPDPGARRADRPRRHDLARGRRRARDGEAVRRGLRGARRSTRARARSRSASTRCSVGDVITIDGGTGRVIVGPVRLVPPAIDENFGTILGWADELRRLRVRANADTPEDAAKAREFGAEGIGLCRTEHMFMAQDRLPVVQEMIMARDEAGRRAALDELLPDAAGGLRGDLRGDGGLPRHDPPARPAAARVPARRAEEATSDAMRRRIAELHEANPMLGTRGCRLGLQWPEIYEMQVRAIVRAAAAVRAAHGRGAARRDHAPARRLPRGAARGCAS